MDLIIKSFLKTEVNGTIIGSVRAFVDQGTCYIGKLIVHQNFQNQGTGTKLKNEIEKFFDKSKRWKKYRTELTLSLTLRVILSCGMVVRGQAISGKALCNLVL